MSLTGMILRFILENSASKNNLDMLCRQLEESTDEISGRMTRSTDSAANRKHAAHIIGLERWGAHRLRAALENPDVISSLDEYDGYRPYENLPLRGLVQEFLQARAETLELIDAARDHQDMRIPHNEIGNISIRAWFAYLNGHATMEAKKIK